MAKQSARPVLILKQDVPSVYGFTERQIKRWIVDKRIDHVHPSGKNGPCYVKSAQLEALIADSTLPAAGSSKTA